MIPFSYILIVLNVVVVVLSCLGQHINKHNKVTCYVSIIVTRLIIYITDLFKYSNRTFTNHSTSVE